MDAIEKRARELLAIGYEEDGLPGRAALIRDRSAYVEQPDRRALQAISLALAPPEGYVLVNHTQLRQLLRDVVTAADFVGGRGQSKPLARRLADQAWALIESRDDAALPEVPSA